VIPLDRSGCLNVWRHARLSEGEPLVDGRRGLRPSRPALRFERRYAQQRSEVADVRDQTWPLCQIREWAPPLRARPRPCTCGGRLVQAPIERPTFCLRVELELLKRDSAAPSLPSGFLEVVQRARGASKSGYWVSDLPSGAAMRPGCGGCTRAGADCRARWLKPSATLSACSAATLGRISRSLCRGRRLQTLDRAVAIVQATRRRSTANGERLMLFASSQAPVEVGDDPRQGGGRGSSACPKVAVEPLALVCGVSLCPSWRSRWPLIHPPRVGQRAITGALALASER
jgi:hypothetical protein